MESNVESRGRGRPRKIILEPIIKRPKGRPRKDGSNSIITTGEQELIRYYLIDKTGTAQVTVKGAADSVALFLLDKNVANFIVIKCGKTERIVNLKGLSYNDMVTTLESS